MNIRLVKNIHQRTLHHTTVICQWNCLKLNTTHLQLQRQRRILHHNPTDLIHQNRSFQAQVYDDYFNLIITIHFELSCVYRLPLFVINIDTVIISNLLCLMPFFWLFARRQSFAFTKQCNISNRNQYSVRL